MKYAFLFFMTLGTAVLATSAKAQYASQMDAAYFATVKAVADYKIDDQENLKEMNSLREDARFNTKLRGMLDKLSNDKNKTDKNRRVYEILRKAGKEIYDILK